MMVESCEKLNNQAINLAASGNFEEAIACLKRAITIEKENYLLWFNLGLTYRDAGDLVSARDSIEKAFFMNPSDPEVLETLAVINLSLGHLDESLNYCFLGLRMDSMNSHLWNTIGVINFKRGDYPTAAEAFEHALYIYPYYYDALFNLRDTYEELGNAAGVQSCNEKMAMWKK